MLSRFCTENKPDQLGYVANAAGLNYIDLGVGSFLTNVGFAHIIGQPPGPNIGTGRNPNPDWAVPRTPIRRQSSGPNFAQRRHAAASRFREGVHA